MNAETHPKDQSTVRSENQLEQSQFLDQFESYKALSAKEEVAWCEDIVATEHALWETAIRSPFAQLVFGRWLGEQKIEVPLFGLSKEALRASVDDLRLRLDCDRSIQRNVVRLVATTTYPRTGVWRSKVVKLAQELDRKKNDFVKQNIRLVALVAKRHGHATRKWSGAMSLADVMQEGSVGLLRALHRFDVSRGMRFSTFAFFWIRACISRSVADQNRTVRTPVHLLDTAAMAGKKISAHLARTGEYLTASELSACSGLSEPKAQETITFLRTNYYGGGTGNTISIDASWTDQTRNEDAPDRIQLLATEPDAEALLIEREESKTLEVLCVLDPLEARVVRWKCGLESDEKNMREIGEELNLSRERVRQIYTTALQKMKEEIECQSDSQ